MQVRAMVAVLVIGTAVLASCGDSRSDDTGDGRRPRALTDDTSTTSTEITTTSLALSDIAVVGSIPELPSASLGSAFGGPRRIETICISTSFDDSVHDSFWTGGKEVTMKDVLNEAFELMDVEALTSPDAEKSACDVALTVTGSAELLSADYSSIGGCYNGYERTGRAIAQIGDQDFHWSLDGRLTPPGQVTESSCIDAPGPVDSDVFPVATALADLFGPLGSAAAHLAGVPGPPRHIQSLDAEAFDVVLAFLYAEDLDRQCALVQELDWSYPALEPTLTEAIVPQLLVIWSDVIDAESGSRRGDGSGEHDSCWWNVQSLLQHLTGERLDEPEEWAEWWRAESQ